MYVHLSLTLATLFRRIDVEIWLYYYSASFSAFLWVVCLACTSQAALSSSCTRYVAFFLGLYCGESRVWITSLYLCCRSTRALLHPRQRTRCFQASSFLRSNAVDMMCSVQRCLWTMSGCSVPDVYNVNETYNVCGQASCTAGLVGFACGE